MIAPPRPPHDDPELLIKEARARRRRRHLLTAAGVAIAAALALGIYAITGGADNRSATGGSPQRSVPACRASQLATTAEGGPGEDPLQDAAAIQLADTGSQACVLPSGIPEVTFALRGKTLRTRERTMQPPYTELGIRASHVLTPARKVMYILHWRYCWRPGLETRGEAATVTLRFGNGLRFALPEGTPENIPIVPDCAKEAGLPATVLVTPLLRVVPA
jgi:hypothetical protein